MTPETTYTYTPSAASTPGWEEEEEFFFFFPGGTNIAVLLDCSNSSRQCSLYYLLTSYLLTVLRPYFSVLKYKLAGAFLRRFFSPPPVVCSTIA